MNPSLAQDHIFHVISGMHPAAGCCRAYAPNMIDSDFLPLVCHARQRRRLSAPRAYVLTRYK